VQSSLGLLSSAGCGSLLVNGAAQAKKKQKTAMMIKKTLFKEVSTVLLAFLLNSTTVPALVGSYTINCCHAACKKGHQGDCII